MKHGILSKEVLVRGKHFRENSRKLTALHQRFVDSLQPVGPVEEMLVDQIVTAQWRLRRALMAESGEIALSVDQGKRERKEGINSELMWMEWGAASDPIPSMERSALGSRVLEKWLGEVKTMVEEEGELTKAAVKKLTEHFGGKENGLTRELEDFRLGLKLNPEGLEGEALREANKQKALKFLSRKLENAWWRKLEFEDQDAKEEASRQAAAVLPRMDVVEKIIRYETKLERQMHRAMVQLERLQRMRHGEVVPAPLAVQVLEEKE